MNKRKRLLKADKNHNCTTNAPTSRGLNKEIIDFLRAGRPARATYAWVPNQIFEMLSKLLKISARPTLHLT